MVGEDSGWMPVGVPWRTSDIEWRLHGPDDAGHSSGPVCTRRMDFLSLSAWWKVRRRSNREAWAMRAYADTWPQGD